MTVTFIGVVVARQHQTIVTEGRQMPGPTFQPSPSHKISGRVIKTQDKHACHELSPEDRGCVLRLQMLQHNFLPGQSAQPSLLWGLITYHVVARWTTSRFKGISLVL